MKYGAKMLQWAPFAQSDPEPAGALPKYGTPVNLGALNKVTDSPTFNEAKGYGDNALKVHSRKPASMWRSTSWPIRLLPPSLAQSWTMKMRRIYTSARRTIRPTEDWAFISPKCWRAT